MLSAPLLAIAAQAATVAPGAVPPPAVEHAPPTPPGREQADIWVPVSMLEARTPAARRELMLDRIRREIAARGAAVDGDAVERILRAMRTLPRERFVPADQRPSAYLPGSVDIGQGQTLSAAYLVTVMILAADVRPGSRVLEIGTGSGYQAALLARLGARVTSVEILPGLARQAAARLRRLGFHDLRLMIGDGTAGDPASAPFDAILVTAGAEAVPSPLVAQLAPGGRLVMPVGPSQMAEQLLVYRKLPGGETRACTLGYAAAVPLTGGASGGAVAAPVAMPFCFGRPVT